MIGIAQSMYSVTFSLQSMSGQCKLLFLTGLLRPQTLVSNGINVLGALLLGEVHNGRQCVILQLAYIRFHCQ